MRRERPQSNTPRLFLLKGLKSGVNLRAQQGGGLVGAGIKRGGD